jgi:hypothetical protein
MQMKGRCQVVSPVDFLNPRTQYADKDTRLARLNICRKCEQLTSVKICSICKCFMPAKVKLADAECPKGAWGPVNNVEG